MGFLTDDRIREIGRIYVENLVKGLPDSKLFINTLPANYQFIGMILHALPKTKIIYCHRDPTDHCLLVYLKRYKNGNNYSYDLANVASYYTDYHEMMAHWRRLYKDRIFSVRYEDLVRDPAGMGARIYAFCGLDHDPTAVASGFTTGEIGHWKHYESHLNALRQTLERFTRRSNGD